MDRKLIRWARAVKARRRGGLPPLWLFSDPVRLPDPSSVLRRLPKGLCGLVFRPATAPVPPAMLRHLAAICRARAFPMVVSCRTGQAGIGRHFPGSRAIARHQSGLRTAAAHDPAELMRAQRGGVDCVFLSPAFATASHPSAPALGCVGWNRLALASRVPVMALGGVSGANAGRLSSRCHGAGVIAASLLP